MCGMFKLTVNTSSKVGRSETIALSDAPLCEAVSGTCLETPAGSKIEKEVKTQRCWDNDNG